MTDLPGNVSVCGVKGTFAYARLVAGDADGVMDLVPVVGLVVTLTASPTYLLNATASPKALVIVPEPLALVTDSNGDLRDVDGNATAYVIASDDVDLNPHDWTYTVSFSGPGSDKFRAYSAAFPGGTTVDLSLITPIPSALGISVSVAQAAEAAAAAYATAAAASASTAVAATATKVDKTQNARNITDYGVSRGTTATQTAAIKAALDAYPGEPFYFPPGDYRLDTSLLVSQSNTLVLDPGARIYAAQAMATLIAYTPALGAGLFAEDKAITGGLLDGNLLADTVLSVTKVLHLTLARVTIRDGLNRGLVTTAPGAEIFAHDLRFYNTTASNVANNAAIQSGMGDCHYRDIVIRDWSTGVIDTAAAKWDRVHPWIGGDPQMTARYPGSIAFDLAGDSDLIGTYADTYQVAYWFRTGGGHARATRCSATWNSVALPAPLAAANPASVLHIDSGVNVTFDGGWLLGHSPGSHASFVAGSAAGLTASGNNFVAYINGAADVRAGAVQGSTFFAPTLFGSTTEGTPTYTNQYGQMIVERGSVTYQFQVRATLDATVAGNLRIGGIPLPAAGTSVSAGSGYIGYGTGTTASVFITGGGSTVEFIPIIRSGASSIEVDAVPLRSTLVEIWGAIQLTF
jgi:hypothetical protein